MTISSSIFKSGALSLGLITLAACGEPDNSPLVTTNPTALVDGTGVQGAYYVLNPDGTCGDRVVVAAIAFDFKHNKGVGFEQADSHAVNSKSACANVSNVFAGAALGSTMPAAEIDNSSLSGSTAIATSTSGVGGGGGHK